MIYTADEYNDKFGSKLTEEQEQNVLCRWLKDSYSEVLYTVDLGGINLNKYQRAVHSSRARRGHPDIILQEWYLDKYCGLAIEFKKTGVKVSKKDGTLRANKHLQEQLEYLTALKERYYVAGFVCGINNAKKVIEAYLKADSSSLATINKYIYPKIKLNDT